MPKPEQTYIFSEIAEYFCTLEDLRQTILYYTKYTQNNSRAFFLR